MNPEYQKMNPEYQKMNLEYQKMNPEYQKMNPEYQKALQQYRTAKHLLHTTFPLIKDPKLLMGVIHNITAAFEFGVESGVESLKNQQGRIAPKSICFEAKLSLLRESRKINQGQIDLINKLRRIIALHKRSPIEFKRGNKQVICSEDYKLEILSIPEIEDYLVRAEEFLTGMTDH